MHRVLVLALDGVVPSDLSTPIDIFGRATDPCGRPLYEVLVCGPAQQVDAGAFTVGVPHPLEILATADTVVVPGVATPTRQVDPAVLDALRAAPGRLMSICVGAFVLAAAGVLDGRRATTHWAAAAELARRHPTVTVDPDVLFVDEGQVLTSAGAAAGLDLCLHLIRRDHGVEAAARTARLSVAPLERAGGQAQFIAYEPPGPTGTSLEPLLAWLGENLDRPVSLAELASRASMSPRTLSRQFRAQTGTTPLSWMNRQRVRLAQRLLEQTDHSCERIGGLVGFGSPTAFRERFREVAGVSPRVYRSTFRGR